MGLPGRGLRQGLEELGTSCLNRREPGCVLETLGAAQTRSTQFCRFCHQGFESPLLIQRVGRVGASGCAKPSDLTETASSYSPGTPQGL